MKLVQRLNSGIMSNIKIIYVDDTVNKTKNEIVIYSTGILGSNHLSIVSINE